MNLFRRLQPVAARGALRARCSTRKEDRVRHRPARIRALLLAASASYIAVPAAMRLALPEANPSIALTLSLGVTFPFNLVLGIPLYISAAGRIAQ